MKAERGESAGTIPGGADLMAHVDVLYGVARHLAGTPDDAEDLVQETLLRAVRAVQRFTPGTNLRAWLLRILRNAWVDGARAAARHPGGEPLEEDPDGADAPGAGAPLRGDADLERMRAIVGEEIEAALRTLSPDARTVVLLDVEGFTEAEIAEVMGCATGTVKSRLARARAVLRERLADYRR